MAEIQIWLVGADADEALDSEIFDTIDAAQIKQAQEHADSLYGDARMRIYSARVVITPEDLAIRG